MHECTHTRAHMQPQTHNMPARPSVRLPTHAHTHIYTSKHKSAQAHQEHKHAQRHQQKHTERRHTCTHRYTHNSKHTKKKNLLIYWKKDYASLVLLYHCSFFCIKLRIIVVQYSYLLKNLLV